MKPVFAVITRNEIEWLCSALACPSSTDVLRYGYCDRLNDELVLVATNRHRLHCLRLGVDLPDFNGLMFNARELLYEITDPGPWRHQQALIGIGEKEMGIVDIGENLEEVANDLDSFHECEGFVDLIPYDENRAFPFWTRVLPPIENVTAGPPKIGLNRTYLVEACALEERNQGVFIYQQRDPKMPIRIEPREGNRWFAVIMPMTSEDCR